MEKLRNIEPPEEEEPEKMVQIELDEYSAEWILKWYEIMKPVLHYSSLGEFLMECVRKRIGPYLHLGRGKF